MVLQIVFQDNLNPSAPNLSDRFTDAVGFFISAPLIAVEYEVDCFLQVYFPAIIGEQTRVINLGKITEQSILLNLTDTETANIIPNEFLDTGLEMALLFLSSDTTFIQAAIVKKTCSLTEICSDLTQVKNALNLIANFLGVPIAPLPVIPSSTQQAFFFLQ